MEKGQGMKTLILERVTAKEKSQLFECDSDGARIRMISFSLYAY